MEVSRRDDVPFVDQVPAGVAELVESLGVRIVSSASLITGTYAQWGDRGYEAHVRAGVLLADIAEAAFEKGLEAVHERTRFAEHDLAQWILSRIAAAGLTEGGTIVAVGSNSASAHYEPVAGRSAVLEAGEVLLIDLWGKIAGDPDAVFADQTWMGFMGTEIPEREQEVWRAVHGAREAAVKWAEDHFENPETPLRGCDVDAASRAVIEQAGFADNCNHRTGHSIDNEIHGIGPNIDGVETQDERILLPGIAFSIEPGVYLAEEEIGVRSEINVYLGPDGPEVTTPKPQAEMYRLLSEGWERSSNL
jgi:Xaa-Pro aminopeptidase